MNAARHARVRIAEKTSSGPPVRLPSTTRRSWKCLRADVEDRSNGKVRGLKQCDCIAVDPGTHQATYAHSCGAPNYSTAIRSEYFCAIVDSRRHMISYVRTHYYVRENHATLARRSTEICQYQYICSYVCNCRQQFDG
jgi:hypothetical protein